MSKHKWIIKFIYLISVYIFKKIFIKTGKVLKFKRIGLFTINVLRVVKTMDNACRGYRKDTLLLKIIRSVLMKIIEELSKKIKLTETEKEMFEQK